MQAHLCVHCPVLPLLSTMTLITGGGRAKWTRRHAAAGSEGKRQGGHVETEVQEWRGRRSLRGTGRNEEEIHRQSDGRRVSTGGGAVQGR